MTQLTTEVQFWAQDEENRWSLKHKFHSDVQVGSAAATRDGKRLLLSEVRMDKPKPAGISWLEHMSHENPTGEKRIHRWNISNLEQPLRLKPLELPAELSAIKKWGALTIEIDPEGRFAAGMYYLGDDHGFYAVVWNLRTGESRYIENGMRPRFSSDGRWLSIIRSGSLELYEVEHLDEFPNRSPSFYQRSDFLTVSNFTDGGQSLLLPGYQTSWVKVWSISENQEIVSLSHTGVLGAQASDDGRVVATISRDAIRLWDFNELPERTRLLGHEGGTTGLAYSHDGRYLATTGKDGFVRIWDTDSGKLVTRPLELENEAGMAVGFSENGRWLAAGSGGPSSRVWIWDTKTWKLLTTFNADVGRKTWSVHFCDSDRKLAVAGHSGLRLLNVNAEASFSIQAISDETLLASNKVPHLASDNQRLYWLQDEKDDNEVQPGDGLYSYSFANAPSRKGKRIEAFDPTLFGLGVHPRDGLYYSDDGRIKRCSPEGQEADSKIARSARCLAVHSQKPWAAMALNKDLGGFEIRNRETGKSIFKFPARGTIVWYLAFHPTKNQLAVARSGGIVELWNLDEVEAELRDLGL